jgi:peptide/nickel transport system substrate-binding protein
MARTSSCLSRPSVLPKDQKTKREGGEVRVVRLRWVLVGVLALALAGSGGAISSPSAQQSKPVLTIGLAIGPVNLDPAKDVIGQAILMHELAFATITHLNPDGTITGDLATSFRYVGKQPNKRFEFTLRKNAHFSDGTPVTAAAVKTWLEYWLSAKGPFSSFVGPVKSVDATGKWTVRITFASPNPIVPLLLSQAFTWGVVSSPNAVASPSSLGTQTFGAGPYTLVSAQTVINDHYTYVPDPYYWDKSAVKWSKVVVRVITNPSSMLDALKTGQVDVAAGTPSTAAAAKSAGARVLRTSAGTGTLFLLDRGGTLTKPLADKRVRQALNYAVDRATIAKALTTGLGEPTSQVLTTDGWDPKLQNYYTYNPSKAKSLLAAAGYPDGFTLKTLSLAGPFPFDQLTQAVAADFAKVGVKLEITTAATGGQFNQSLVGGKFSATQFLGIGYVPMWLFYSVNVKPKAILNPYGASDPELNADWLKAQRLSAKASARYWKHLSRRMVTEAWNVPLVTNPSIYYVGKRIRGVVIGKPGSGEGGLNDPARWTPAK